jgi:PAS domain S-box-containing protein
LLPEKQEPASKEKAPAVPPAAVVEAEAPVESAGADMKAKERLGHVAPAPATPARTPAAAPPSGAQPLKQTRPLPARQTAGLRTMPVAHRPDTASDSGLALSFQTGIGDWSTLQIVDEVGARAWDEDDHLLVKQVAEQLSLALENARLFQETRQRGEELLKFRLGIERTDNAVFITDTSGQIQYINDGFEKIYGYTREEAIGQTPRILQTADASPEQYDEFWQTLLQRETITGEVLNRAKDGHLVSIAATTSPILDENDTILGFLALHAEITAQKMAQETIRRRSEYLAVSAEIARLVTSTLDLQTIFSRTVDLIQERFGSYYAAIFIVDEAGERATLEAAAGGPAESPAGHDYSIALDGPTIVATVASTGVPIVVNETEKETVHELTIRLPETKAEAALPLRVGERIIGALDIHGSSVGAFAEDEIAVLQTLADQVAVAIDNARSYQLSQKAVEEIRELDRLKSQFLANMSHELRTPLNSIIGFSRVIIKGIDGPVTELQHQDLNAIYNAGQHLLGLINDILDVSKIEAGKMELAFDEVNITELINSVMATMSGLIKDKPIVLKRNIQADLPDVRADAMRVRQVMINLLSNAAKFTEQGEIEVEAALTKDAAGKREIMVRVRDTGPGIAGQDQKKLFQAFSQVDDSPTRRTSGTGLGLAISQSLIDMHGGHMGVESAPGQGSIFYFTLPVDAVTASQPAETGSATILVVDDDLDDLNAIGEMLSSDGRYAVLLALGGQKGWDLLSAGTRPAALVLDLSMQDLDGLRFLENLRRDARLREIPAIVMTVSELNLKQEERLKGLAQRVLAKASLAPDTLLTALDEVLHAGNGTAENTGT